MSGAVSSGFACSTGDVMPMRYYIVRDVFTDAKKRTVSADQRGQSRHASSSAAADADAIASQYRGSG